MMPGTGAITLTAPWLLVALAVLPAIWWLLRVVPPAPRQRLFPPLRLLAQLRGREETPARTPWWLMALRLVVAALIVVALAQPILAPQQGAGGSGPVILAVDDGWRSAPTWRERQQLASAILDRARREGRQVRLLTTAAPRAEARGRLSGPLSPADARQRLAGLSPKPWPGDRAAALKALQNAELSGSAQAYWLSDGLQPAAAAESGETPVARQLMARLQETGGLTLYRPEAAPLYRLATPRHAGQALTVTVSRASDGLAQREVAVRAHNDDGRLLARSTARFDEGARTAEARFDMPLQARNAVARLAVAESRSAGGVFLLDQRWRRQAVGIAQPAGDGAVAQPLLRGSYYLQNALGDQARVTTGPIDGLLADSPGLLVLPDQGQLPAGQGERLRQWVGDGGVLLRFAGPNLAAAAGELRPDRDLIPVPLYRGDRTLGGTLTWDEPRPLAGFAQDSPLAGLSAADGVTVERQVLAQATGRLAGHSWARLDDGTPLVTGRREGDGWVVLVHTSAAPGWSNLPLSESYVALLNRLAALAPGRGAAPAAETVLTPRRSLDGYGVLQAPPAGATPLTGADFADTASRDGLPQAGLVGPNHPPGFYGTNGQRRSLNLGSAVATPVALPAAPEGVQVQAGFAPPGEIDLRPPLLAAALILLLIDMAIALYLRGFAGLPRRRAGAGPAAVLAAGLALTLAASPPARAQDSFAVESSADTWLAYVATGDARQDRISRAGLEGLARGLRRRTSVEAAGAKAVDPGEDPLILFPLIYWPVTGAGPELDAEARQALTHYREVGGLVLFDLRDPAGTSAGDNQERLRRLVGPQGLPPLEPVPSDHVLTKTFYLLQAFPGRYTGDGLWIEQRPGAPTASENVATVLVGAHDWAGAWARTDDGSAMFQLSPGGSRQRELALRSGINMVMYALTGTYKADQVHVPAILNRLGQ